ncbi:class I SAM-dependent methyltransferase [Haloarchaeobius iranensis]|uniref:Methyltransferase domain-containing protein n=1 Tax=Haloarchaeobius iranensis TaxID=996166 RepID=A0A1G9YLG9_9EURY|nr:class I SAM-dependent methyltransferase [Haloarchaeobius iranensis]SDN09822.1 Methyltransferase domain-containing protein [Haloarchaeobius iranensis]
MPKSRPFERHTDRYDAWFEANDAAYRSEVASLERLVPHPGEGLEIGVGTARFAAPLGIAVGIDPAVEMLARARRRGVDVARGVAEDLPFRDGSFDTALVVTTICFVDDIPQTLSEARRVLRPDGSLVIGFIDRDSPVGQMYQETQSENPFYREAVFVSTDELVDALEAAGFSEFEFVQTIYRWPGELDEQDRIEEGHGEGSFVAIEASP